jgi:hypothetical protein
MNVRSFLILFTWMALPFGLQSEPSNSSEGYGKKIVQLNKEIKESRALFETCKKEKGDKSEDCKKMAEDLKKKRAERDAVIKSIPEGRGLSKGLRKEIRRDRAAEKKGAIENPDSEQPSEQVDTE